MSVTTARDPGQAPTDQPAERLVEGGFATREEAEAAMFAYAEKLRKMGQTQRYGVRVRPMYVRNPGQAGRPRQHRAGWGVYVRDRAC